MNLQARSVDQNGFGFTARAVFPPLHIRSTRMLTIHVAPIRGLQTEIALGRGINDR